MVFVKILALFFIAVLNRALDGTGEHVVIYVYGHVEHLEVLVLVSGKVLLGHVRLVSAHLLSKILA